MDMTESNLRVCPKCGHRGPVERRKPGGPLLSIGELVDPTGVVWIGRGLAATLHCAECGALIEESVVAKGIDAAKKARGFFAGLRGV
jgi:DNA-directed RNA polymerase subunit RPC12/RpoP